MRSIAPSLVSLLVCCACAEVHSREADAIKASAGAGRTAPIAATGRTQGAAAGGTTLSTITPPSAPPPPDIHPTPVRVSAAGAAAAPIDAGPVVPRPDAGSATPPSGDAGVRSIETCMTDAITQTRATVDKACAACACSVNLAAIETCNTSAGCWPLLTCIATECTGFTGNALPECAVRACSAFLQGAMPAQPAYEVLSGKCRASCDTLFVRASDAGE